MWLSWFVPGNGRQLPFFPLPSTAPHPPLVPQATNLGGSFPSVTTHIQSISKLVSSATSNPRVTHFSPCSPSRPRGAGAQSSWDGGSATGSEIISKLVFPGREDPFPIVSLITNKDDIFVLFPDWFRTQGIKDTFLSSPPQINPNTLIRLIGQRIFLFITSQIPHFTYTT